jgi:hypothetical protein
VRHAASGSIGCYLGDHRLNVGIEFCIGHGQLEDDYPGRLLIASPATVNVWNALPASASAGGGPATGNRFGDDLYQFLDQPAVTP